MLLLVTVLHGVVLRLQCLSSNCVGQKCCPSGCTVGCSSTGVCSGAAAGAPCTSNSQVGVASASDAPVLLAMLPFLRPTGSASHISLGKQQRHQHQRQQYISFVRFPTLLLKLCVVFHLHRADGCSRCTGSVRRTTAKAFSRRTAARPMSSHLAAPAATPRRALVPPGRAC
jgi:hypothetical protein